MSTFDNFGNNLIKLRKRKNITQMELAEILGVSYSTIAMYETNKRQPRMDVVVKIANYFDVPISELIEIETTDTNIINVLNNLKNIALDGNFTFKNRKVTKKTLKILLTTIEDLKSKIIYYENKEELRQRQLKIDIIKEKYNLSDIDLEALKSDLNNL